MEEQPVVCLFNHCVHEEWDEADLRMDELDEYELFEEATATNDYGWTCAAHIANRTGPQSLLERLLQVTGTGVFPSTTIVVSLLPSIYDSERGIVRDIMDYIGPKTPPKDEGWCKSGE